MKKNDIYKLIGYNGEYNTNVKKAIRKLLKENHPDKNGNREIFELVNEVKKELEDGKVSYTKKDIPDNKNNEIDYDYFYKTIDELKTKKINLNELLDNKKRVLNKYQDKYKDLYQNSLDIESNLLTNTPLTNKLNNIRSISIVFSVLIVIVFILSILENSNILFVIFVVLTIICVYFVQKNLLLVHKMAEKNKKSLKNYVRINNDIKKNIKEQEAVKKEINDIKRKIIHVENDLRFYKNLLK